MVHISLERHIHTYATHMDASVVLSDTPLEVETWSEANSSASKQRRKRDRTEENSSKSTVAEQPAHHGSELESDWLRSEHPISEGEKEIMDVEQIPIHHIDQNKVLLDVLDKNDNSVTFMDLEKILTDEDRTPVTNVKAFAKFADGLKFGGRWYGSMKRLYDSVYTSEGSRDLKRRMTKACMLLYILRRHLKYKDTDTGPGLAASIIIALPAYSNIKRVLDTYTAAINVRRVSVKKDRAQKEYKQTGERVQGNALLHGVIERTSPTSQAEQVMFDRLMADPDIMALYTTKGIDQRAVEGAVMLHIICLIAQRSDALGNDTGIKLAKDATFNALKNGVLSDNNIKALDKTQEKKTRAPRKKKTEEV